MQIRYGPQQKNCIFFDFLAHLPQKVGDPCYKLYTIQYTLYDIRAYVLVLLLIKLDISIFIFIRQYLHYKLSCTRYLATAYTDIYQKPENWFCG